MSAAPGRDVRFQRALENAPDIGLSPKRSTRGRILAAAAGNKQLGLRGILDRLKQLVTLPPIPVLVGLCAIVFIGLTFKHQAPTSQPSPVSIAESTPAAPKPNPSVASADTPQPAEAGSERSKASQPTAKPEPQGAPQRDQQREVANALNRPVAPATTQAAKPPTEVIAKPSAEIANQSQDAATVQAVPPAPAPAPAAAPLAATPRAAPAATEPRISMRARESEVELALTDEQWSMLQNKLVTFENKTSRSTEPPQGANASPMLSRRLRLPNGQIERWTVFESELRIKRPTPIETVYGLTTPQRQQLIEMLQVLR